MQLQSSPEDRISIVDALRGFSLWGIIVVHLIEQYLGGYPPPDRVNYAVHFPADEVVKAINKAFFLSKFFTIFSLLFGLSFFIQMDRAGRRGQRFTGRFAWRLLVLFAIGFAHNLFFRGDILTVYALLGLLLILFYRAPDWLLLSVSGLIVAGGPRFLVQWVKLRWTEPMTEAGRAAFNAANTHYFYTVKTGTLWDVFSLNVWDGWLSKMAFQFDVFGRGYLTFALFLLGLFLGRRRFFERISSYQHLFLPAITVGLVLTLGLEGLRQQLFRNFDIRSWETMRGLAIQDIQNLSFTLVLISAFFLIYLNRKGRKVLEILSPYGRMALTNYFTQSVIGTFIFFGFGLGLLGDIGALTCFIIAQGITTFQIGISHFWMRFFKYGPLEWFWRSATYLRWQPIWKRNT